MTEAWITVVTNSNGRRKARRWALHRSVNYHLDRLEKCSNLELREVLRDINAEIERRAEAQARRDAADDFDPDKTQYRGDTA